MEMEGDGNFKMGWVMRGMAVKEGAKGRIKKSSKIAKS